MPTKPTSGYKQAISDTTRAQTIQSSFGSWVSFPSLFIVLINLLIVFLVFKLHIRMYHCETTNVWGRLPKPLLPVKTGCEAIKWDWEGERDAGRPVEGDVCPVSASRPLDACHVTDVAVAPLALDTTAPTTDALQPHEHLLMGCMVCGSDDDGIQTTGRHTIHRRHTTHPQPHEQLLVGWLVGGMTMGKGYTCKANARTLKTLRSQPHNPQPQQHPEPPPWATDEGRLAIGNNREWEWLPGNLVILVVEMALGRHVVFL